MAAPGWHGKLPTFGDFASRRLDSAFIEAWDHWLAVGIAALQSTDAAGWLQAYLDSPSWRFLLMPNALPGGLGTKAWAGVLMPSVDRVGRYYPFTIAQQLDVLPSSVSDCQQLSEWCDKLEETAVNALFFDWTIDRLEATLEILQAPAFLYRAAPTGTASTGPIPQESKPMRQSSTLQHVLLDYALGTLPTDTHGFTFWIANGEEEPQAVLTTQGLPAGAKFTALFRRATGVPGVGAMSGLTS